VVKLGVGVREEDLLVHDEKGSMAFHFMLAHMAPPEFPMPLGVIRRTEAPTLETAVHRQIGEITAQKGAGDLKRLIYSGDIWEVR
jgi:2-oxoglutarate ferredoxin oxidoreductase subunit beta